MTDLEKADSVLLWYRIWMQKVHPKEDTTADRKEKTDDSNA